MYTIYQNLNVYTVIQKYNTRMHVEYIYMQDFS